MEFELNEKRQIVDKFGNVLPLESIVVLLDASQRINNWIKSDSVYTALEYASENPSMAGINECNDTYFYDLFYLSEYLRK